MKTLNKKLGDKYRERSDLGGAGGDRKKKIDTLSKYRERSDLGGE